MNRLDRITSILIQLQSKKIITAREIAKRYEVSIRTIYRDIQTLREAGVPIGEEEGKGYFLVDGYRLPPIMFSPEEANAMVLIEKMLAVNTEKSLQKNYESALFKVKAVLHEHVKDQVTDLSSKICTGRSWITPSSFLENIQNAIVTSNTLLIQYQSKSKKETTSRKINPYGIFFSGASWSVIAYCQLRQDIREFRVDRMNNLEVTDEQFEADEHFSLEDYTTQRNKKTEAILNKYREEYEAFKKFKKNLQPLT